MFMKWYDFQDVLWIDCNIVQVYETIRNLVYAYEVIGIFLYIYEIKGNFSLFSIFNSHHMSY